MPNLPLLTRTPYRRGAAEAEFGGGGGGGGGGLKFDTIMISLQICAYTSSSQNLPKYLIRSSFVAMNSRAISTTFRVSVSSL